MTEPFDYDDDGNPVDADGNLIEEPDPDEKALLRKLRGDLSRTGKARSKAEAELAEARRELAIAKAGLTDLEPKKVTALLAAHDGDLTPDLLRATAVTLGFAEAPDTSAEDAATAAANASGDTQTAISQAVTGAQPGTGGLLKGAAVADWSTEKKLAFRDAHPEAWEQLKRGEDVPAIAGYQ